jgi:hypothetical protein
LLHAHLINEERAICLPLLLLIIVFAIKFTDQIAVRVAALVGGLERALQACDVHKCCTQSCCKQPGN